MKKGTVLTFVLFFAALSAVFAGGNKDKTPYRTLDQIKSAGEIVMLTNAEFAPFEYIAGNAVAGVDPDLARIIADQIGVKLRIVNMDFDLLVDALKSGKGDFIAAGMTATEERALSIDFSHPYVKNGLLIITPVESPIKAPEDLAGKRIAVQEGTTADLYVTDNVKGATVLSFKAIDILGDAVREGKADAAILDIVPAQGIVANSRGALILLPERLTDEDMSMATAKGNQSLLEVIVGVLDKAVSDGTVDALVEKHQEASSNAE
jgi:polar amino acid transport system substrate-binding protein